MLPNLDSSRLATAITLTFEPYTDTLGLGWDNSATYGTSEDFALLNSTFRFFALEGATYDIFSNSFFDPFVLILYDVNGIVLAADQSDQTIGSTYGMDYIFGYQADYTGYHYLSASWDQGNADAHKYVSVGVYEDTDSISASPLPQPNPQPEPVPQPQPDLDDGRLVTGSINADDLLGGTGDDTISGFSGNDTIVGQAGNDEIFGGFGDDELDGGSGTDIIYGEEGNDLLFGGSGDDTINGGSGNDEIRKYGSGNSLLLGEEGNDLLWAGAISGNDTLEGGEGNDILIGGAGSDTLDGGAGFDNATYKFTKDVYTLIISPASVYVQDRRLDGDGLDVLVDIERILFEGDFSRPAAERGNAIIDYSTFNGSVTLSASDFESFIELYIAYFNRSPDAVGLNFWGTAFANGTTLEQMATLFVDQDETRATYPEGTSNTDFVTAVYNNVLGRIPDQAGFDFWIDMLNRSAETGVTRDQFILEVLRGVQDGSSDRAFLDSKVDIGAYFAVHRGMSDVDNASAAMALFDGSQTSINQAVAAIDGFYQDALDPNTGEFLMQVVGVLDNPFAA